MTGFKILFLIHSFKMHPWCPSHLRLDLSLIKHLDFADLIWEGKQCSAFKGIVSFRCFILWIQCYKAFLASLLLSARSPKSQEGREGPSVPGQWLTECQDPREVGTEQKCTGGLVSQPVAGGAG